MVYHEKSVEGAIKVCSENGMRGQTFGGEVEMKVSGRRHRYVLHSKGRRNQGINIRWKLIQKMNDRRQEITKQSRHEL